MWDVNAGPWKCETCGKEVHRFRPSSLCGECARNARRAEQGLDPISSAAIASMAAEDDRRAVGA